MKIIFERDASMQHDAKLAHRNMNENKITLVLHVLYTFVRHKNKFSNEIFSAANGLKRHIDRLDGDFEHFFPILFFFIISRVQFRRQCGKAMSAIFYNMYPMFFFYLFRKYNIRFVVI